MNASLTPLALLAYMPISIVPKKAVRTFATIEGPKGMPAASRNFWVDDNNIRHSDKGSRSARDFLFKRSSEFTL